MSTKTSIEWTSTTWNPVTGCTKISDGCKNCYAERMAKRLKAMGQRNYSNGFEVTLHEHVLNMPLRLKRPQTIFVNSMSDLFHKEVPSEFIHRAFDVMRRTPWHTYQILTKRSGRLLQLDSGIQWPKNVWMGVTVESDKYTKRIDDLRNTHAITKFLSIEPLLSRIPRIDLTGIDWVIVGGESGPHARPMNKEWVIEIRDYCQEAGVPFFFKQWGGFHKKRAGRLLDGKTWDEMPSMILS